MKNRCFLALSVTTLFILTPFSGAENQRDKSLRLASLFADNMVLQQQTDAAVWGKSEPLQEVSVEASWSEDAYKTNADGEGNWRTTIKTPQAGGPFTLTVKSGDETIELKNVLSGEVWICSGQSNMQWKMDGYGPDHFGVDIQKVNAPNIRYCMVDQILALKSQEEIGTNWSVCGPSTVSKYSAVAYFFGSKLHQELHVPIGLISTNWGGSGVQAWTREEVLMKKFPEFIPRLKIYPKLIKETGMFYPYDRTKRPKEINQRNPAVLYNSMINPLIPFAFRGVIWYQGESNVSDPEQYRNLFPAMIEDWRDQWGIGEFPFYFVQIAPFNYKSEPISSAFLREAQLTALSLPNTGMAVIMDIGDPNNIHPRQKKPVGDRLALIALAKDYGRKDLVYSGPLYQSYKVEGNRIRLTFDHIGSGLNSRDGKELTHFTIAGNDKQFVDATAVIDGDTIIVSSPDVPGPVAVRFGWGDADITNLSNKEGLPASSFRTDNWPIEK
jgi:sialate O-acetylesterase